MCFYMLLFLPVPNADKQHPGLYQELCCQQFKGGDLFPLLSSSKATLEVLCPVPDSPVQERYGHTGESLAKDD